MNRCIRDLHTRARNQPAQRRCDFYPVMLVERLQYKYALGQNDGQCHDRHVASVAGIEELPGNAGLLLVVLHQMANDEIGVDQPSLAHRMPSRPRAAFAAASRISEKGIPLPFLLANAPLSASVPRCTRIVT